jgi:hypothetical protein
MVAASGCPGRALVGGEDPAGTAARFHHQSPATTGVPIHVVYLDGPQLGTTRALRRYPLLPDVLCPSASPRYRPLVLYVANDSPASADSIQASGLVDHVSRSAVNEALTGDWREAPFAGAYVDLCAGTVATLLATLERLFCPGRPLVRPFVLGYTLTKLLSNQLPKLKFPLSLIISPQMICMDLLTV